jgi:hypothetical protein
MEINRLTREADELIRKIVARYNSLYSSTGVISQLELDLMLDEIRLMYEKFKLIGQLNLQHKHQDHPRVAAPQSAENQVPASSIQDRKPEPENSPEPVPEEVIPADKPIAEGKEEVEHEKQSDTASRLQETQRTDPVPATLEKEKPEPVLEQQEQKPAFNHTDNPQTVADKFRSDQKSLGDVLSGSKEETTLGSRLGNVPVSDLKSVIGFADKFAFVNELFGGDSLAYEKAITQLNSATRLAEAEAYLGTIRLNHRWPADSDQAARFTEIIRRKFSS